MRIESITSLQAQAYSFKCIEYHIVNACSVRLNRDQQHTIVRAVIEDTRFSWINENRLYHDTISPPDLGSLESSKLYQMVDGFVG